MTTPPGWRHGTAQEGVRSTLASASVRASDFFSAAFAHLLVGKEVDDWVVDGTGLGKVHGHGGDQRGDVKLWIHDNHH